MAALDQAAKRLQSKGGFKLYMYLAKNQDKYSFALSSADFMVWSGLGYTAYTSAFKELEEQGYLILKEGSETVYTFYDRSELRDPDDPIIENLPEKVEEIQQLQAQFVF